MQKWVHLTLADGKTIDATEGHPFNTPDGWRDALLLKKGGQVILKGENGEAKSIAIADVSVAERRLTTYNLEVANVHTFFVGEDAVLVHNGIFKRWQVGDAIDKPLPCGDNPSWRTVRSRYWKNCAASSLPNEFSQKNLDKMRKGKAPVDFNLRNGKRL